MAKLGVAFTRGPARRHPLATGAVEALKVAALQHEVLHNHVTLMTDADGQAQCSC